MGAKEGNQNAAGPHKMHSIKTGAKYGAAIGGGAKFASGIGRTAYGIARGAPLAVAAIGVPVSAVAAVPSLVGGAALGTVGGLGYAGYRGVKNAIKKK